MAQTRILQFPLGSTSTARLNWHGMPTATTKKRAQARKREGKAASTQAGEFVREQVSKMKRGKGNARNRKQAVAIGLSEARRSGVKVPAEPRSKRQKSSSGTKKKTRSRSRK
jgi:hypothetical protein